MLCALESRVVVRGWPPSWALRLSSDATSWAVDGWAATLLKARVLIIKVKSTAAVRFINTCPVKIRVNDAEDSVQ